MISLKKIKRCIRLNLAKSRMGYVLYRYYTHWNFIRSNFEIKDIIVCGIQRSGSTLAYNYAKEIIAYKNENHDGFFSQDKEYKDLLMNEYSGLVKKTHRYSPFVAKRIKKGKSIGIFTHRDIRDILVSAMQIGWIETPYDWMETDRLRYMMHNAILYAEIENILIFSYRKIINNPQKVIRCIADKLDFSIQVDIVEKIIDKYSIENVRNKLHKMPESKRVDIGNQLHKAHVADSKIGKWKSFLSDKELYDIENYCNEYLEYFGYRKT